MTIRGVCAKCGFVFLLDYGLECPACVLAARAESVRKTFAPVDPLRTALGIHGLFRIKDGKVVPLSREELEEGSRWMRWHGEEPSYIPEQEDEAKFRIPKGERAQIWELKRMRKLIGKL